tara:strand:- start:3303 stop:3896 length:594 start_codon:yes stop_codon:yes gene_type:complete
MKLPKFLQNLKTHYKILFYIILLIIIFDKLVIFLLTPGFNKLCEIYNSYTKENFKNLGYSRFEPPENVAHNLGQIFKNSELNLDEYPNVEIKPGQQIFQDNKFLPECCLYYSQYSTDKGCPCITPEQQQYLSRRGLNKAGFEKNESDYKNVFFSPTMALKGKTPPFVQNNIYFQRDEPEISDSKVNKILSLINESTV